VRAWSPGAAIKLVEWDDADSKPDEEEAEQAERAYCRWRGAIQLWEKRMKEQNKEHS
jgi:hypothetical protein